MAEKKIPQRTCIGCNTERSKKELLRVVRAPDGSVSVDTTGKKSGRGAYLCYSADCLKKAVKSKRLERKLDVPIPQEIYASVESAIADFKG